jgi:NitT/TauT family transport system substrate-binding protein
VALEEGFFREQGLDIEISTMQDANSVLQALLSQKVDFVLGKPELTVYAYQQGRDNYALNFAAVAHTGQAGGKVSCTVLMASKSFIEQHPDIVQKMTDGLYMGERWVESHNPEETARALQQFFPESDLETITWEVGASKNLGVWETTPVLEYGDFIRLENILAQSSMTYKPVDPGILVTQKFALIAIRTIQ